MCIFSPQRLVPKGTQTDPTVRDRESIASQDAPEQEAGITSKAGTPIQAL